jgi:low temperature requirement A protein (LtrA)
MRGSCGRGWPSPWQGNWRLRGAGHWTERHGLFIILALGESVVAIGVGAAQQPISGPLLLAAVLGVAAAVTSAKGRNRSADQTWLSDGVSWSGRWA